MRAGVFRIRRGQEIIISRAPGANLSLVRLYLVGKVLATLLYQRGLLVLHGSAVEVNGQAVCFVGSSYFGKSSIAASLHRCGHKVVADDVTALDMCFDTPLAIPAFPQLKLDPGVARSLGYADDSLIGLDPLEPRRGLRVHESFTTSAAARFNPCSALMSRLNSLSSRSSAHQAGSQFFSRPTEPVGRRLHLLQYTRLAKVVPIAEAGRAGVPHATGRVSIRVRQDLAASQAAK